MLESKHFCPALCQHVHQTYRRYILFLNFKFKNILLQDLGGFEFSCEPICFNCNWVVRKLTPYQTGFTAHSSMCWTSSAPKRFLFKRFTWAKKLIKNGRQVRLEVLCFSLTLHENWIQLQITGLRSDQLILTLYKSWEQLAFWDAAILHVNCFVIGENKKQRSQNKLLYYKKLVFTRSWDGNREIAVTMIYS